MKDKVILITGGSKGLGLKLAEYLIKEGAHIAICARDEEELWQAKLHLERAAKHIIKEFGEKAQDEGLLHNS